MGYEAWDIERIDDLESQLDAEKARADRLQADWDELLCEECDEHPLSASVIELRKEKAHADEAIKLGLQAISTEMAGCRVPSLKSGSDDDEGNCDKCEDDTRSHCFERMMFDRLADLKRRVGGAT
jgi:hypothetical protein